MQALTLGTFIFFTALVGLLTWLLTRHDRHDTSAGYFLGGRSLTAGYIAGSLLLTNLSTEQLIGLNGAAFSDGLCVMAWEVSASVSLVIMALFFLPRYLKSGIATIPQYLELRFNHHTRVITTLIFIFAYTVILLPMVLYSGATGLNSILEIRTLFGFANETAALWFTVWLIGIIGSIYAIFGGLRTVAVSDTLNGVGLLCGGVLIAVYGLSTIGQGNPLSGLSTMLSEHPERFNSIGGPSSSVPFSTLFSGVMLLSLFYWCTNQQIIQRTFGASSLKEGQQGVLLAGVMKMLAPIILVVPGMIAFHQFGVLEVAGDRQIIIDVIKEPVAVVGSYTPSSTASDEGKTQPASDLTLYGDDAIALLKLSEKPIAEQLEAKRTLMEQPLPWQAGTFTGTAILQRGDVLTETESGSGFLLHRGIADDEMLNQLVAPRKRDLAYGTLVRNVLPPYLTGFFAAVIIGAILSSFNSALNSTATLFSLGVYKSMLHPDSSETAQIRAGKLFGLIIAVIAMTVAPLLQGQDSLFGYLQKMNGLYFIPIFSVVLIGMFTRRTPAFAANIALVVGFTAISIGYFQPQAAAVVAKMHEFHFLGAVFVCLLGLMLVIRYVSPRTEPWVQIDTKQVDLTPWKAAKPLGALLIAFVVILYIALADLSVLW